MWQLYVYSFVAGLFGANGVPHFIKGITGQKFQTPFGTDSSALLNVVWGWLNFVLAAMLLYFGNIHPHLLRAFSLTAIGALLMALLLSYHWGEKNTKKK